MPAEASYSPVHGESTPSRAPTYESKRYAFHVLRVGATLIRKRDGRSVYFQPGDDTAYAIEQVEHCFSVPEMFEGENNRVFDAWASEYFAT